MTGQRAREPVPPWSWGPMVVDESGLVALAVALGQVLRGGEVLLLHGPMGAGKTTFTRGLAQGLGVLRPERVRSPTFNICVEYPGPIPLVHVDLCRLGELSPAPGGAGSTPAFEALGLDDLADEFADGDSVRVLAVEWAQLWGDPPAHHLAIALALEGEPARRMEVIGRGTRGQATLQQWRKKGDRRV